MKQEIEIKILNIDAKKLSMNIKNLGGKKILEPTLLSELYFESPIRNPRYSSFRLRSEGKQTLLTLKMKKDDPHFEIRDEYQVEVQSFEMTKQILELAGFKVFRQREKIRESYMVETVRVEIDTYPHMKPYAEIEAASKKDALKFLKQIGFELEYASKKTATEIIRDAGLNPDDLMFEKK
ncbi:MAG: class IV adenylate cyclase [Candidatus Uhrbacteria bacterium]|nr:class IV adenylate cyclase [Candidatus Uhrbacteria bacterium]